MEAIIFVGLPGSGKSSFYKERFFDSHVRISLDLLKTDLDLPMKNEYSQFVRSLISQPQTQGA